MKRFLLTVITLVFLGYALIVASSQNLLGINQYASFKSKVDYGRKLTGIGALFTREGTLVNYQTLYQFYQNGQWESWHLLEQETFNEYVNKGNLFELKHSHLDTKLSKDLYFGIYLKKKEIAQSIAYKTLVSHLILGHHNNQVPDSIRIVYQIKKINSSGKIELKNLLTHISSL